MVKILMNLAYAPKSITKDFVFGPGIATEFKKAIEAERRMNRRASDKSDSEDGPPTSTNEKNFSAMEFKRSAPLTGDLKKLKLGKLL